LQSLVEWLIKGKNGSIVRVDSVPEKIDKKEMHKMEVWKLTGIVLVIVIMASMVTGWSKAEEAGDIIVFTNVNVIPMDEERVLSDQTVIIRDGRINKVGSTSLI